MKPVNYHKMASSLNGGHKDLGLDCLLSTSKVMYCEKCGFVSADTMVFKNHMLEHMGTRFYCFYCNNVSYSEAELHDHLQQHATKYQFKCQHCGRGYMRRQCLFKHIERLHGKATGQGLDEPDVTKNTHVPVSSASSRVSSADAPSVRPTVKVTIPTTITPPAGLGKDRQGGKMVNINVPSVSRVDAELLSPLNELVQHNRSVTVSLPEEVTIPAGCLVELVEVKTVNGTKELKLRIVSQQENESVIKDSRTTISQNTTLSATLSNPSAVKFATMGMCTGNRKQSETKNLNVQRPAVGPDNVAKNIPSQVSKEKCGTKRTLQEMMNLNVECPTVPAKVSKSVPNTAREGNCGIKITQRETVNLHAAPPILIPAKTTSHLMSILNPGNRGMCVSQRTPDEKNNLIPGHPKSFPPRMISDMKSTPRDLQLAVKEEPSEISHKDNTTSRIKEEAVGQKRQSLKSASPSLGVPLTANGQGRSSALLVFKDNVTADPSFRMSDTARRTPIDPVLTRQPMVEGGSALTDSKTSAWTQSGRCSERAFEGDMPEPENFPVISSVFSLSQQQPEDVQGSIQPLVMALRGIVMSKSNCSVKMTPDHIKPTNVIAGRTEETQTSGYCAQVFKKGISFTRDQLLTRETSETVKIEEADKCIQHTQTDTQNLYHIKEETKCATSKDNKCSQTPSPKSLPSTAQQEAVSTIASHTSASVTERPLQQMPDSATNEHDISTRFLTVTLKRIQVGLWKQSKKRLKLRKPKTPMGSANAVLRLTPLKEDQLVKRPGPNQPVVVLNHPKPQVPKRGARAAAIADTGTSEVVPKCQILKMRLSKVMGQKYEVMGCTVRVFP